MLERKHGQGLGLDLSCATDQSASRSSARLSRHLLFNASDFPPARPAGSDPPAPSSDPSEVDSTDHTSLGEDSCGQEPIRARLCAGEDWPQQGQPAQGYRAAGTSRPPRPGPPATAASSPSSLRGPAREHSPAAHEEASEEAAISSSGAASPWTTLGRLVVFGMRHRRLVVAGNIAMVANSAGLALLPMLSGSALDSIGQGDSISEFVARFVLLIVVIAGAASLRAVCFARLSECVCFDLRSLFFRRLLRKDIAFFDREHSGALLSRLAADVDSVQSVFSDYLSILLRSSLMLLGSLGLLLTLSWKLALLIALIAPLTALSITAFFRRLKRLQRQYSDQAAEASKLASEVLVNIRLVRSFAQEDRESQEYERELGSLRAIGWEKGFWEGVTLAIIAVGGNGLVLAVIVGGDRLIRQGEMTLGTLTSFMLYTISLTMSVASVSTAYSKIVATLAQAEKLFHIMDTPVCVEDPAAEPALEPGCPGKGPPSKALFSQLRLPRRTSRRHEDACELLASSGSLASSISAAEASEPAQSHSDRDRCGRSLHRQHFEETQVGANRQGVGADSSQGGSRASEGTRSLKHLLLPREPSLLSQPCGSAFEGRGAEYAVEFEDVTFAYPSKQSAAILEHFSLKVKVGESVALVGASGSGKSTILSLLLRFYDVSRGTIRVMGRDIRTLPLRRLHQLVGFVAQEPTLFAATIRFNVEYGVDDSALSDERGPGEPHSRRAGKRRDSGRARKADDCPSSKAELSWPNPEEELARALEAANAVEFLSDKDTFPEGLETVVGERGVRLSGGQKQRIAIGRRGDSARCLLKDPQIVALDEATSALDAHSEFQVQQAVARLMLARQKTTVVVAHRLSTVVHCDTIAVLKGGRVVEQGSHAALLAQRGDYASLFERQLRDSV